MTEQQILQKSIENAVKNGWDELELWSKTFTVSVDDTSSNRKRVWIEYEEGDGEGMMLFDIIFSHQFAKAFYGTKKIGYDFVNHREIQMWHSKLQEQVLSNNPIRYLEPFLEGGENEKI